MPIIFQILSVKAAKSIEKILQDVFLAWIRYKKKNLKMLLLIYFFLGINLRRLGENQGYIVVDSDHTNTLYACIYN